MLLMRKRLFQQRPLRICCLWNECDPGVIRPSSLSRMSRPSGQTGVGGYAHQFGPGRVQHADHWLVGADAGELVREIDSHRPVSEDVSVGVEQQMWQERAPG